MIKPPIYQLRHTELSTKSDFWGSGGTTSVFSLDHPLLVCFSHIGFSFILGGLSQFAFTTLLMPHQIK